MVMCVIVWVWDYHGDGVMSLGDYVCVGSSGITVLMLWVQSVVTMVMYVLGGIWGFLGDVCVLRVESGVTMVMCYG